MRDRKRGGRANQNEARTKKENLGFDLSLKALRHSFAITKEAKEEHLFIIIIGGRGIHFSGVPVSKPQLLRKLLLCKHIHKLC